MVRGVREQVAVERRVIGERPRGLEPNRTTWRARSRVEKVVLAVGGPDLEGALGDRARLDGIWELREGGRRGDTLLVGRERLRRGDVRRHLVLMLETGLLRLEGRREVEDGIAALDG